MTRAQQLAKDMFAEFCGRTGRDASAYDIFKLGAKNEPTREHCVVAFRPASGSAFVVKSTVLPKDTSLFQKRMKSHRFAFDKGAPVPRPFWVFDDHQTVVMEHCDGASAHTLALAPDADLGDIAVRAGRWLREFHAACGTKPRQFNPSFMLGHVERLMGEANSGARRIPSFRRYRRGAARLADFAVPADGAPVESALAHGDLNPKNILLGPRPVGLDFAAFNTAPVVYDMARFLVGLQTTVRRGWSSEYVIEPRILEGFCAGHGTIEPDDPVLQFLLRARVLIDWSALHDSPMSLTKYRRFRRLRSGAATIFR